MKRAVVTGPTGEIGNALLKLLIENKIEVLAICRPGSMRMQYMPKSPYLKVRECDLSKLPTLYDIKEKYDVFYHFGWFGSYGEQRDNLYIQHQNIRYELDAIQLAKRLGCEVFIGAGTQAEYGRKTAPLTAETKAEPETAYGMAKLCAGQMSRLACGELGIRHIWVRVASVYGPCDGPYTLISYIMDRLKKGEEIVLTKCEQIWDYLFSEDAARAFYLIAEKGENQKIYCLGSGEAKPLREYIEDVQNLVDKYKLSSTIQIGGKKYRSDQMMYLCANIKELREDTGFMPTTTFFEGLEKTYQWYLALNYGE